MAPIPRAPTNGVWWLAVGLLLGSFCSPARAESPAVTSLLKPMDLRGYPSGTTPPLFNGHTLEARRVSIADLRGKVLLVNFWASWCRECRPEMPALERLHRELAPRGLAVVGINAREDREAVRRYAKDLDLTFTLVLDPDGTINAAYGVVGLPTTFVIGRDGRAVALAVGPREWASVPARAIIEALLAEPGPRPDGR
ncbi:MAG: TlpA family protein disulfide reductase [Candidatus Rokuibacteriota bacterium]|nr:MAG: TlpA family protein disulfide reductase [Candidatus Rokubacteria bacterium]